MWYPSSALIINRHYSLPQITEETGKCWNIHVQQGCHGTDLLTQSSSILLPITKDASPYSKWAQLKKTTTRCIAKINEWGSPAPMDTFVAQLLHLCMAQGTPWKRGWKDCKEPEYQEVHCEIASLRNGCINKTQPMMTSIDMLM